MGQFRLGLHNHTGRLREKFSEQSSEITFILCAAACDVGGSPTYNNRKSHDSIIPHARQALGKTVSSTHKGLMTKWPHHAGPRSCKLDSSRWNLQCIQATTDLESLIEQLCRYFAFIDGHLNVGKVL